MTDLDRVARLESRIRSFKILTSGDGDIQGGFGPLPKANDLETRLSNLQKSVNGFQLVGNNVSVSGSIKDGFIVS